MINNLYDSITFEVEKGLTKPKAFYPKSKIKTIFTDLFKKEIIEYQNDFNDSAKNFKDFRSRRFSKYYKNLEILHSNFDTEKDEFYYYENKSLIKGLIEAYKNHYPITVSPDMFWILFLQGYTRFMEKYGEILRIKYVNFKGKKPILVQRFGIFPEQASKETWQDIINDFTKGIKNHIGEEFISQLESNFSTTNPVSLCRSQMTIMSAMKSYFDYSLGMGGCGISSIALEGSLEDWKKMKQKFEFLSQKKIMV